MWFWKTFVISFSLASICLDRGGCAPYNYFDVGDIVANSDVQRPWSKCDSRKTRLVREVSETKSTNNLPTRGLFYPDDMFFTNWVPSVSTTEECSKSSGSNSSCSISKSTLKTKNDDKSAKYQTTLGQRKSTSAVKSSLRHQHTSSSADVQSSTSNVHTSSLARPSLPRRRKTSTFVTPSLPRRRRPSTIAVTSLSRRRHKTFTFIAPSSPIGKQKSMVYGRSTTSSPRDYDFAVASSTGGQRKYSHNHSSIYRQKYTFDLESSPSGHRKLTRSSATSTADYTHDPDYFTYSDERR